MSPEFTLNQIPFGEQESDGVLVDVHQVARGAQCGCRCASCKTPLIARQGEEKVWHFAHASRGNHRHTVGACEFSFFVSVRLMARQLLGNDLVLAPPEYRGRVCRYVPDLNGTRETEYRITPTGVTRLEQVLVEVDFSGVVIDLKGKVNSYDLAVYFIHPGRQVPDALSRFEGETAGILAINLEGLAARFASRARDKMTYARTLSEFLSMDREHKRWIYHPRQARIRAQAEQILDAEVAREVGEATRIRRYECEYCGEKWQNRRGGLIRCPGCAKHLGVQKIGFA